MTACPVPTALAVGPMTCELSPSAMPVPNGISGTGDFDYHLKLQFADGDPNLVRNHIPLDPSHGNLVIRKKANTKSASLGDLIVWSIQIKNPEDIPSTPAIIIDVLPVGLSYIAGTSSVDGLNMEPSIDGASLTWNIGSVAPARAITIEFATRINPGIVFGVLTNTVQGFDEDGLPISNIGESSVEIIPEHVFDCGEVIGKVFDDKDRDGYQDQGEEGIAGVHIYTLKGLKITTDKHGRYHIPCAAIPNHQRGSNFPLKLDTDTLPTGYRLTSENPRVLRLTRGKLSKGNFGAHLGNVVGMTITDDVFEGCSCYIVKKTEEDLTKLVNTLVKRPSVVQLTYYAKNADHVLANQRMEQMVSTIRTLWKDVVRAPYRLEVEYAVILDDPAPLACEDAPSVEASKAVDDGKVLDVLEPIEDEAKKAVQLPEFMQELKNIISDPTPLPEPEPQVLPQLEPEPAIEILRRVLSLHREINFETNKDVILKESYPELDSAGAVIKQYENQIETIVIEGHTDSRGSAIYNTGLSQRRAEACRRYLMQHWGIDPFKLRAIGYGESRPKFDEVDAMSMRGNRRVEFRVDGIVEETSQVLY